MKIRSNDVRKETFCLNKERGYRLVMKEAFSVLLTYIRTWFLSVWHLCLVSGFLITILSLVDKGPLSKPIDGLLAVAFLYVWAVMIHVSQAVLDSKSVTDDGGLLPVTPRQICKLFLPASTTFFILLLCAVLVGAVWVAGCEFLPGKEWAGILMTVLTMMIMVYCILTVYRRIVFSSSSVKAAGWALSEYFRQFWKTLFFLFCSVCVCAILFFLLVLPVLILNMNIQFSNQAVAMGDSTDFPSCMVWVTLLLSMVLTSLASFFFLILMIPFHLQMHSVYAGETRQ